MPNSEKCPNQPKTTPETSTNLGETKDGVRAISISGNEILLADEKQLEIARLALDVASIGEQQQISKTLHNIALESGCYWKTMVQSDECLDGEMRLKQIDVDKMEENIKIAKSTLKTTLGKLMFLENTINLTKK